MSTTTSTTYPSPSRFPIFRLLGFLVLALSGIGLCVWYLDRPPVLPRRVSLADYQRAQQRFRELYRRSATHADALSLLAEMAVAEKRPEIALACFREIPSEDPKYGLSARLQQGQVNLGLNRARDAEQNLREYLELTNTRSAPPEHIRVAYEQLVFILSAELRFEDRHDVLADMHALHFANVFDSKQFFFPNLLIWNSATGRHRLQEFLTYHPEDVKLGTAHGRYLLAEGKFTEAYVYLQALHERRPSDLYCLAALLECDFDQFSFGNLQSHLERAPEYAKTEPWLLTRMRGEFANYKQDWKTAILQFERLQQSDPANPWAQMGLAKAYAGLKQAELRGRALQRSLVLSQIRVNLMTVKEEQPQPALALAKLCDQVGMADAAETFRAHAARIKLTMPSRNSDRGATP